MRSKQRVPRCQQRCACEPCHPVGSGLVAAREREVDSQKRSLRTSRAKERDGEGDTERSRSRSRARERRVLVSRHPDPGRGGRETETEIENEREEAGEKEGIYASSRDVSGQIYDSRINAQSSVAVST